MVRIALCARSLAMRYRALMAVVKVVKRSSQYTRLFSEPSRYRRVRLVFRVEESRVEWVSTMRWQPPSQPLIKTTLPLACTIFLLTQSILSFVPPQNVTHQQSENIVQRLASLIQDAFEKLVIDSRPRSKQATAHIGPATQRGGGTLGVKLGRRKPSLNQGLNITSPHL